MFEIKIKKQTPAAGGYARIKSSVTWRIFLYQLQYCGRGAIAQLARVLAWQARGQEFESP